MATKKHPAVERPYDRPTGRHTAAEKAEILKQVDAGRRQTEVARQYGLNPVTISRWLAARKAAQRAGDGSGVSGLRARSTRPLDSASPVTPAQRDLVIELKQEHPEMGPAQLRNQLRRFQGVSLSHKVIGKILKQNGFVLEKRVADREDEQVQRFEMSRPNEMWTMDVKAFYIHDLKVYLIDVIDDYSRFVVGYDLLRESSAEHAIAVVRSAIARHGKPERILTDRGSEFHSWGAKASAFTSFLEEEQIAHSLARPYHPQTCGKIEAVHATLEKELLGRIRFDSFSHAKRELERYFDGYNFERTHMGIGGVTPADRYFGRVPRVLTAIEASTPSLDRGGARQRTPGERAVVLQLAIVNGCLELWFAGKRVELG